MWSMMKTALTLAASIAAFSTTCPAQLLVSANDGKVVLNNGVVEYMRDGKDSVTVIDIANGDKVVAEVEAPSSVLCPPSNVAISPDRNTVLVASARKYQGDPAKAVSDDRLTFIDVQALRASQAGKAPRENGEALGQ